MTDRKQYLGDAVYANFDGYHVVLTTTEGFYDTNTIYLDPHVVTALLDYVREIDAMRAKQLGASTCED